MAIRDKIPADVKEKNCGVAIILPEGALDLDERVCQVLQETNSLNEDRRLTKNHA